MRIGIDIRSLQNDSQLRGIGTYTRCLIQSLLSLDKENEYVLLPSATGLCRIYLYKGRESM